MTELMGKIGYKNPHVKFEHTQAYKNIKKFILEIHKTIISSPSVEELNPMSLLIEMEKIIKEIPLSNEPTRFANKSMIKVIEHAEQITMGNLYFSESFGNKIRMDYGTGHELNFLCYLYYLTDGVVEKNINFILFNLWFYMRLIKTFIRKYNVEPAGARGCWSINDFTLLGYVFGSSINIIEPMQSQFYFKYSDIWFASIENPNPLLSQLISGDSQTINAELLKMYFEEVLEKFVVTQHFIYSDKLPDTIVSVPNLNNDE